MENAAEKNRHFKNLKVFEFGNILFHGYEKKDEMESEEFKNMKRLLEKFHEGALKHYNQKAEKSDSKLQDYLMKDFLMPYYYGYFISEVLLTPTSSSPGYDDFKALESDFIDQVKNTPVGDQMPCSEDVNDHMDYFCEVSGTLQDEEDEDEDRGMWRERTLAQAYAFALGNINLIGDAVSLVNWSVLSVNDAGNRLINAYELFREEAAEKGNPRPQPKWEEEFIEYSIPDIDFDVSFPDTDSEQENESDSESESDFSDEEEQEVSGSQEVGSDSESNSETSIIDDQTIYEDFKDFIEGGGPCIILHGAPGTGKTWFAERIAERIKEDYKKGEAVPLHKQVQFHPSYDYTDFVEGLRPVEKDGTISFQKRDGHFKKFCRDVVKANTPSIPHVFIIDEINRADLSKVFGELMYSFEGNKRGIDHKMPTQYQNLPTYGEDGELLDRDCFSDGFYIPENVVIIGTMNDVDRSVESMDIALRRRFLWYEIKTEDVLENGLTAILESERKKIQAEGSAEETIDPAVKEVVEEMVKRISALNQYIGDEGGKSKYYLNHNYDISQGQFSGWPKPWYENLLEETQGDVELRVTNFLENVWKYRLENLLAEYVRGEGEEAEREFLDTCREKLEI